MKIVLIFLGLVSFLFSSEPFRYDPFLKPPKVNVEEKQESISQVVEKAQIKRRVPLRVEAVMGKKVFVNGQWYARGDKIGEYTLYMIKNNVVGFKINEKLYIEPVGGGRSVLVIKEKK